jgi:hypothetical protein
VLPLTSESVDTLTLMKQFPSLFQVFLEDGKEKNGTELKAAEISLIEKVYITSHVNSEVVNPVQSNKVDVIVNGRTIEVCDFITPDWFKIGKKGPFNYKKTLTAPFELDKGGYVDFFLTNLPGYPSKVRLFMFN